MIVCVSQKTAYALLISDWRSDVCSSDLDGQTPRLPDFIQPDGAMEGEVNLDDYDVDPFYTDPDAVGCFYRIVRANKQGTNWFDEIFDPAPMTSHNFSVREVGRASGRERVCRYV